jgi:hypothetical protein
MERNNIALHKHLEKKHNINQYNKSLKAPYEYFKKLNILPVSLVEGEMDKYFTFEELLFEDFKDYNCIGNKNYSWPYTWLCPIFYQNLYNSVKTYFNYNDAKIEYCESKNIPQELITLYNFKSYFAPIQMLWKIVSENIKNEFKSDLIYNYNTNIKNLNNTIEELANKQKGYIKALKYKIPVDKLPPNSQLEIEYDKNSYSRYDEIIILKVCNKIIKYMEEQYGYNTVEEQLNSLTIKRRQVKKQDLEEDLVNNIYKVKDYDSGKYYIYENGIVKLED